MITVDEKLKHIAFIMDGNGRWATSKGHSREYGHKKGADTFRRIVRHCGDIGIKCVTVYAFSTENWKRSEKEVNAIMQLLSLYIDDAMKTFREDKVKIVFIGDLSRIPDAIVKKARKLERMTADYELRCNIAINYGGRDELIRAVNSLIKKGEDINEASISSSLDTSGCPDPDLIVRTAGEYRLSNFLLWQSAYSELYITDILWPDLTNDDVDKAINDFYLRTRRFGKA